MRVAALVALILLAATPARADQDCTAPLSDWQPREALVAQLEADGWRDIEIRVHDGCYLVHADKPEGDRLHGKFDPVTLTKLPGGRGRGHGEARHGGDAED
jgi:hypothetical protein